LEKVAAGLTLVYEESAPCSFCQYVGARQERWAIVLSKLYSYSGMIELDVRDLDRQAIRFESRLNRIKTSPGNDAIVWYPYRTLAIFPILDKLLTGPRRKLLELAAGDPILDIGCGDGSMAFFLESLGCNVSAFDNPHTNHNQMRGFVALHSTLRSSVTFHAIDLDSQFSLPDDISGLAILLGVLYHLKNPYYALEALATRARYCLLSTRIAQRTPEGVALNKESLAYFLAPGEANGDWTNYWIFSEIALRRLIERTGWTVRDFLTTGVTRGSDPVREDRDERAFCLLESERCPRFSVRLLDGWHALEQNRFRWTQRRFSISLKCPPLLKPSRLRFTFRLTTPGPICLSAGINGTSAGQETFIGVGAHSFNIELPNGALSVSLVRIDFCTEKNVPAVAFDERELALLVVFWEPGLDQADTTLPFELI
jgi:tRNA (mo5U34)-methyltransferase